MTTARDIHEHLQRVGAWVDWEHTCDGFKYGDPDTDIKGIAVGWQSLQSELETAHEAGCNLFITHEPTFYSHMDDDQALKETAPARAKAEFLERTGMVVYRCHDVWDVFPEIGVVDAWGRFLELGEPITSEGYYRVYDIPTTTAWELTDYVHQHVTRLGQQAVQLLGSQWQMVHRLAIGTGAITNVRTMVNLGADAVLTTNDGVSFWRDGAWALDRGIPMLVVDHRTSEIPGIRNLAAYIGEQFQIPTRFVGPTCSFVVMASSRTSEVPVRMRLDDLDQLPTVELPDGYTLRAMKADEVWAYVQVMNESIFAGSIALDWFDRPFAQDPEYDPSYLQIIWRGDRPVAVSGAWHTDVDGARWGMVHWVGVSRDERGKGLGKAITLAALRRIRERGMQRALLDTQNWRLPAIAAYLRLGFVPWPKDDTNQRVWDEILVNLGTWRKWGGPRPRQNTN